jgi:hypothetical protein
MSYGLQVFNGSGSIAMSTEDKPLVVYARYTLTSLSTTSTWFAYNYQTALPFNTPGSESYNSSSGNPLYTFSLPGGLTIGPETFLGFNVPTGKTIFTRYLYQSSGRLIMANTNSIDLVVAGPLLALSNYTSTNGMIVYNSAGTAIYHSDARVVRIAKKIDASGTFSNPNNHSPYFFTSGNYFYQVNTSNQRFLRMTGVRLDSSTTFTRRLLNNVGVTFPAARPWETDPLGNGFIGLIDKSLF